MLFWFGKGELLRLHHHGLRSNGKTG
jgi:hypothetical protein